MYAIGEFPGPAGRNEVAIVYKQWINGGKCFWPPFWRNPKLLEKALRNGVTADPTTWFQYEVRVVGGRYFRTYDEARIKLNSAVDHSELSSDEPMDRLRKRTHPANDIDTDSEDSDNQVSPSVQNLPKKRKSAGSSKPTSTIPPPPTPPTPMQDARINTDTSPRLVAVANMFKEPHEPLSNLADSPQTLTIKEPASPLPVNNFQEVNISTGSNLNNNNVDLSILQDGTFGYSVPTFSYQAPQPQIDFVEYFKAIQTNQELLMAKMDTALDYLRIIAQGGNRMPSSTASTSVVSLPISDMAKFDQINENIRDKAEVKSAVTDLLAKRGGNTPNQIVHQIVGYLMTDALMMEFTFQGHTGKKALKTSHFMDCIYDAVHRHTLGSVLTHVEIDKATEYWLKKASSRIKSSHDKAEKRLKVVGGSALGGQSAGITSPDGHSTGE